MVFQDRVGLGGLDIRVTIFLDQYPYGAYPEEIGLVGYPMKELEGPPSTGAPWLAGPGLLTRKDLGGPLAGRGRWLARKLGDRNLLGPLAGWAGAAVVGRRGGFASFCVCVFFFPGLWARLGGYPNTNEAIHQENETTDRNEDGAKPQTGIREKQYTLICFRCFYFR